MSKITAVDIQRSYIRLYKRLRTYLWDVDTATAIADLEVEVYKTFPNQAALLQAFQTVKRQARPTAQLDADLQSALDRFEKVISEYEEVFAQLKSVDEVVRV